MGNQNSSKPLENLQLDIEKANVQVNVSVNVEDVNVFIDFRISEILIFGVLLAIAIGLFIKLPCKKCRNQSERYSTEQNSHQQSEFSTEIAPNDLPAAFLLRREVESEMYLRETRPFLIETAKTYV